MDKSKTYFNWSGGKDSALALYHIQQEKNLNVQLLLTSVNDKVNRISMHGVRAELLHIQASALGIPLREIRLPETVSMDEYNEVMSKSVNKLVVEEFQATVFGDIFLEDLRSYRGQQLAPTGMHVHFPLWKRDTKELLHEFLDLGFRTIVVCAKASLLAKEFAGRIIDYDFIKDLPVEVDPCGENGEFHTFVFDGPNFKTPIEFSVGEIIYKEYAAPKVDSNVCGPSSQGSEMGFWYCDLLPKSSLKNIATDSQIILGT
jgi:uncharacterized protein (TIGR00290 family)